MAKQRSRSPEPADEKASGCPVPLCPICTAAVVLGNAKPEVIEHLLAATRETLLALRASTETYLPMSESATIASTVLSVAIMTRAGCSRRPPFAGAIKTRSL